MLFHSFTVGDMRWFHLPVMMFLPTVTCKCLYEKFSRLVGGKLLGYTLILSVTFKKMIHSTCIRFSSPSTIHKDTHFSTLLPTLAVSPRVDFVTAVPMGSGGITLWFSFMFSLMANDVGCWLDMKIFSLEKYQFKALSIFKNYIVFLMLSCKRVFFFNILWMLDLFKTLLLRLLSKVKCRFV